jgi:hypothetical protein
VCEPQSAPADWGNQRYPGLVRGRDRRLRQLLTTLGTHALLADIIGLLTHAAYSVPHQLGVDGPLPYGDHYCLRALRIFLQRESAPAPEAGSQAGTGRGPGRQPRRAGRVTVPDPDRGAQAPARSPSTLPSASPPKPSRKQPQPSQGRRSIWRTAGPVSSVPSAVRAAAVHQALTPWAVTGAVQDIRGRLAEITAAGTEDS